MARHILRTAAIAIMFLLHVAPVWAGFEEGAAAYKRGDYGTALREFRPLANQGNARAQYNLGVIYGKGHGVPQDDAEAMKWYRKAADKGFAQAQYSLGIVYSNSRDLEAITDGQDLN